jgi:hypothetical protein
VHPGMDTLAAVVAARLSKTPPHATPPRLRPRKRRPRDEGWARDNQRAAVSVSDRSAQGRSSSRPALISQNDEDGSPPGVQPRAGVGPGLLEASIQPGKSAPHPPTPCPSGSMCLAAGWAPATRSSSDRCPSALPCGLQSVSVAVYTVSAAVATVAARDSGLGWRTDTVI